MQDELDASPGARPVQLLGINGVGAESGNELMVEERDLPLLQDTAEADVWHAWGVRWRDVIVLGPDGSHVDTFNLTDHDLDEDDAYQALLALLRDLAG